MDIEYLTISIKSTNLRVSGMVRNRVRCSVQSGVMNRVSGEWMESEGCAERWRVRVECGGEWVQSKG